MAELKEVEKNIWEVKEKEMAVPARVYANKYVLDLLKSERGEWNSLKQLKNVAMLPGIQKYSLAMSDIHPGYGFCIGGVGAFSVEDGVIAMGGIGYDINCGVRTMRTSLTLKQLEKIKEKVAKALYQSVPAGLGVKGSLSLSMKEIDDVLRNGAEFSVRKGFGTEDDLKYIENYGKILGAMPEQVSQRAKQRQISQVGTLGSGNHYLEVQVVDEIFDEKAAKAFGLEKNQILVSYHCGSRALGHQIGMDWTIKLAEAVKKYSIKIPDRELVCAPINSDEGRKYLGAVKAGMNCAFANREVLGHHIRKALSESSGISEDEIETFYEISHNTAKIEEHKILGKTKKLLVHRKGATRAFGPGSEEIPQKYRKIGQPVLIGGTMGTESYILHGTQKAMEDTFGSACHGAGRILSRTKALKETSAAKIQGELKSKGIIALSHDRRGFVEEAPQAYKDVTQVIDVMHETGIALKVAKLKPIIVVKG